MVYLVHVQRRQKSCRDYYHASPRKSLAYPNDRAVESPLFDRVASTETNSDRPYPTLAVSHAYNREGDAEKKRFT